MAVDFAKAFEKIAHGRILNACKDFNFPPLLYEWIKSFLSDRMQRVTIGGRSSSWTPCTSGVSQGSVIGPILFSLAINDLVPLLQNTSVIKYADDVTFLHFVRTRRDDGLQEEWNNLLPLAVWGPLGNQCLRSGRAGTRMQDGFSAVQRHNGAIIGYQANPGETQVPGTISQLLATN